MTTIDPRAPQSAEPITVIRTSLLRWQRRHNLAQTIRWLPRAFFPALLIGVTLALITWQSGLIPPPLIAALTLGLLAMAAIVCIAIVWRRVDRLGLARRFDLRFDLRERLSTALALADGRLRADPRMAARQIADAAAVSAAIDARSLLPIRPFWRDWALVVLLLTALVIFLLLTPPPGAIDATARAAIGEASDALREAIDDAAADPLLDSEERAALLESLRSERDRLDQPDISPPEAIAALNSAADALDSAADAQQERADAADASARAADDAFDGAAGDALRDLAERAESGDVRPGDGDSLRRAADALQNVDPRSAESLDEAADALERGDAPAARNALDTARERLEAAGDSADAARDSAESLSDAADRAESAAGEIASAEQNDASSSDSFSPSSGGEEGGGAGEANTDGEQPGDGQPSAAIGEVQSESSGGQQQSGEGEPNDDSPTAGAGAGNSEGDAGDDSTITGDSSAPVLQGNTPDGEGLRDFEMLNLPRRLGGEGGIEFGLSGEDDGAPVELGDFTDRDDGIVSVPLDQVFGDYADSANRAIGSGRVPLTLRDLVRDYFTDLAPR